MVIPPEVLLYLRRVFAILGFLLFQMNLKIALSNCIESVDAFGKMAIFTILILPIHERGRSCYLLRSSLTSFFRDLKFLSYRSFTSLVRVTPRYVILFVTIVKDVISLISFSACLSFEYRKATDFLS